MMPRRCKLGRLFAGVALAAAAAFAAPAWADNELDTYKKMLADPFANPGNLYVDEGEALWKKAAGPKNVSLEKCDLGLGAGVVKGAHAKMPRFFADAGRVMDTDTRIAWCREQLQGIPFADSAKTAFSARGKKSDMELLTTYVANQSAGMPLSPQLSHEKEKEALAIGEALFFRRGSLLDYSCATCHGSSGMRIRLQPLAHLTENKAAGKVVGGWPVYRVSQESVRAMQNRMWDCHWQMRYPTIDFGSEATVALVMYLTKMGEGAPVTAPALAR